MTDYPMTREQLIGLITLAIIIWIIIMCLKNGTDGLWGLLLKILFFPLYGIYLLAKIHRERKAARRETKRSWW